MSGHIDVPTLADMVARLVLAAVLGALVGFEREAHGRPAGLRTHMLVCMGSTIFTVVSVSFVGNSPDPSRVAAQIVSGIGFLGAGTIIRQGNAVRGLTTAASLWTIAAIGMAVGVDWRLATCAVIASVVVFAVLTVMNRVEHTLISQRRYRDLAVTMKAGSQGAGEVLDVVVSHGIDVQGVRTEESDELLTRVLTIRLSIPPGVHLDALNQALTGISSLKSFDWD
jgi:putative Mg2+ transporter-C (MgtC) family protein